VLEPDTYRWPRVSPDGDRVAIAAARGEAHVIRTVLLRTGAASELDGESEPVWSVDGRGEPGRPLGRLPVDREWRPGGVRSPVAGDGRAVSDLG
jgi:hypothetical protein